MIKDNVRFCLLLVIGLFIASAMPTFTTAVIACLIVALIAFATA